MHALKLGLISLLGLAGAACGGSTGNSDGSSAVTGAAGGGPVVTSSPVCAVDLNQLSSSAPCGS